MYSLYIFLLLFASFTTFLGGRFLGKYIVFQIHISFLFFSLLLVLFSFYEVVINGLSCEIVFFKWFNILSYNVNIGFLFDTLSVSVSLVVIFISLLVHLFSVEYMWNDPYFIKFFSFLTLFTSLMLLMILSPNFIQFFLGWEGVGIASYLLINFWSTRPEANRSALKALILNRFGDSALYLAFVLLFLVFKTFDFYTLNFLVSNCVNSDNFVLHNIILDNIFSIDFICLLLFLACVGKSAQLGLHIWLPDAMEGPTPVSALLHAATMVTAGIYLILRCSYIFQFSDLSLLVMSWVGLLTMLTVSVIAIGQNDLKKIIAYSTCSHLGYMVLACGSSFYNLALFHLFNHAFFKALLFISAGSLIHITGYQDLRQYRGGLIIIAPVTYITFLIGSISSISFIGSSGYYSKDLIIEHLFLLNKFHEIYIGAFEFIVLISTLLSVIYSFKLLFLAFNSMYPLGYYINSSSFISKNMLSVNKFINNVLCYKNIKLYSDSSSWTLLPLSILTSFSIFGGFIFFNIFNTLKFFQNQIYVDEKFYIYNLEILYNNSFVELPLLFSLAGILSIVSFYFLFEFFSNKKNLNITNFIKKLQINKFYFNLIFIYFIVKAFMNLSFNIFFKFLDRGALDLISPLGLVRYFSKLSNNVNSIQNGSAHYYVFLLSFLFSVLLIIFIFSIFNILQIFIIYFLIFFLFLLIKKND